MSDQRSRPIDEQPIDEQRVARTQPPAKLNLFLELLGRRPDGFHEIDTVMVAVNWRDDLAIRRTQSEPIRIDAQWLPSREQVASWLKVDPDSERGKQLLAIPEDSTNLVCRALARFRDAFGVTGGFACQLGKRIPAGAGMGGASSDAASALLCAANLCGVPRRIADLADVAAEVGSDVPFFLGGDHDSSPVMAARATGRGEAIEPIAMLGELDFVIAYPAVSLSTAEVYAGSRIPPSPQTADRLIQGLQQGDTQQVAAGMMNQLTEPAKKLAPQIDETLESLWQTGLRTCQLTGSGSACFAVASSAEQARRCANEVRALWRNHKIEGALVLAASSTPVPATVEVLPNSYPQR